MPEHLETFKITLRDLHGHTQETVTYLEFKTRKRRHGAKEQLTIGTLVTGQLY